MDRQRRENGRVRVNMTRAVSILPEGKPLWGGPCQKVDMEESDVRPTGGKGSEQDPADRRRGKRRSVKKE